MTASPNTPDTPDTVASTAFRNAIETVAAVEPRIAAAMAQELTDQRGSLKLIASENYASPAVLLAMGSWLSDKYAEGTIGRRFYAGCRNVDTVEAVAAEHARAVFGASHAYVQPHSGIDANLVAFWAILAARVEAPALKEAGLGNVNDLAEADWQRLRRELGNQRLLGMSLDAGGHLTHGFRPNVSGKMFEQASYGTDPATGLLDYAALREQARAFRPLIIVAGYSAYPRLIDFAKMKEIAAEVGATLLVDMAHFAGLVAGGVLTGDENPVPFADVVTTTTHKSLRGPRGGMVLCTEEYSDFVDRGCPLVLGGPLPHVMGAKAVALAEARTQEFRDYSQPGRRQRPRAGRRPAAPRSHAGHRWHRQSPGIAGCFGYGLTGRQAEPALLEAGLVTNRNSVPRDPNGAWYTSGIRLGTPALTTRGFGEDDLREIGEMIDDVLRATEPAGSKAKFALDPAVAARVRDRAAELTAAHPLYPEIDITG